MMSWKEIAAERGTENSVAYKDGKIVSIICGGGLHHDARDGNVIRYNVPSRRYYRKSIERLLLAEEEGQSFVVYWKLAKGIWQNLGPHRVLSHGETPITVVFELVPEPISQD